jgi:hypothetical protein
MDVFDGCDCEEGVPVEIVKRVAAVMSRFVDCDLEVSAGELLAEVSDEPAGDWDAMTGEFFAGLAADERRALLIGLFTFLMDYDEDDAERVDL